MYATFRQLTSFVLAIIATSVCAGTVSAQYSKSSGSQGVPPKIDQTDTPFNNLVEAERSAFSAQAKLAQAFRDYKVAIAQLARTRKAVQDVHRSSPEVIAAQKTLQQAKLALQHAMEPVITDLARVPVYQSLVQRRDALNRQLTDDPNLVGETREAVARELLEVKGQIRNHELAAIEFDAATDKAQKAVHAAEAEMRELNAQTNEEIDQDPHLVQAKTYLSGARQNLMFARQDVATEYARLGMSQGDYRRAAMTNAITNQPGFWYGHYWWR